MMQERAEEKGGLYLGDSNAKLTHMRVTYPRRYGSLLIFVVICMDSGRFVDQAIQIGLAQNIPNY